MLNHAVLNAQTLHVLAADVQDELDAGQECLGAAQVRNLVTALPPDDPLRAGFVDVFIDAPSIEVLRARLECRGEDSPETIARRHGRSIGAIETRLSELGQRDQIQFSMR